MKYRDHPVISRMNQPEELKRAGRWPPSNGRGVDVWAMISAAIAGDLAAMQELVARDPALVNCTYGYLSPLRFAVRENHPQIIDFLLAHGASIAGQWDNLANIARDRGNEELALFFEANLLEQFHIKPAGNEIAAAIKAFDQDRVKGLVEKDPSLVHTADDRGNLPIHWAVLTRQIDLIEYLLANGADINAKRPDGAAPLDLTNGDYNYRSWYRDLPATALQNHAVLLGFLLSRGAYYDISVAAKVGDLQRVKVLVNEDPDLVKKLPSYVTYYSGYALRNAAGAGRYAIVQFLLEHGADPNMPEKDIAAEGGALHSAIQGGHFEIVKLLLEHGANPNASVDSSGNCMYMAKHVGASEDLINLLAGYGGAESVELLCYTGNVVMMAAILNASPQVFIDQHALGSAADNGKQEILELILRFQPEILKTFALHRAQSPAFARWMMERGLNPNRGNWLGATPLHTAAADGNMEMAAVCLEFGADINVTDTDACSTPLGWAAKAGKADMAKWLLEKGADPLLPVDKPWAQPAAWAKRRGHQEVLDLL